MNMTVSPFSSAAEDDVPWRLWEKQTPVIALTGKQTESRYADGDLHHSGAEAQRKPAPIERRQYMAVLNRMHQATGKAGSFSSWDVAR